MKNKMLLCFVCFLYYFNSVSASILSGSVRDKAGNALAFANVYVKGTTYGSATNEEGYYSLLLENGNYTIIFQYLGYTKKEIKISVNGKNIELNVQLEEESKILQDITIVPQQENPAYEIIRQAIKTRMQNLREDSLYICDVYIKGMQILTQAPAKVLGYDLKKIFSLDSNNTGVIYLSESSSKLYFLYPGKIKEVMVASKVSGNNQQFSFNNAAAMYVNFYENNTYIGGLYERGFVSPIADNAFYFYDYELTGSFYDGNRQIYKIKVIPKRNTDPVYTGEIYITDDYHIYSNRLFITKQNGANFIDTLTVTQQYVELPNRIWVTLSTQFYFDYSILGIKGNGYFVAFYKNYDFNPSIGENFFNNEVARIEETAMQKDSAYWKSERPVALTEAEIHDYKQKDSALLKKSSKPSTDSTDKVLNKFSLRHIISGYNYNNSYNKYSIATNPATNFLQYNTVEGFVLYPRIKFIKQYDFKREFSFAHEFRYGFASGKFLINDTVRYDYAPKRFAFLQVEGGSKIVQFTPYGLQPVQNTFHTLALEQNYFKLYRNDYFKVEHFAEIFNGFYIAANAGYYHRTALANNSSFTFIDWKNKMFTPNDIMQDTMSGFPEYPDKFSIEIKLKYALGQKYFSEPYKKDILETKYPTLTAAVEQAIGGIIRSTVQYTKVSFGMQDNIDMKLAGSINYFLSAARNFHTGNIAEPDLFYLAGNQTVIIKYMPESFYKLPYYYLTSDKTMFEAHASWHTNGFLFNALPGFKQLKIQPVFTVNYAWANKNNFTEFAFGFEHIFKLLRADVVYTPYNIIYDTSNKIVRWGIVVGIGI